MVLVLFIAPVGMNLLYSWELARYIAVMGITPKRIEGALLSVLFLFVPMACLAGCFIGIKSTKRIIYAAFGCVLVAGIVFMTVNAAARKSISCHPLPTIIYPLEHQGTGEVVLPGFIRLNWHVESTTPISKTK